MKRCTYKWIVTFLFLIILIVCLLDRQPLSYIENATFVDNDKLQEKFQLQLAKLDNVLNGLNEAEKVVHIPPRPSLTSSSTSTTTTSSV